jgi:hypothetical protein
MRELPSGNGDRIHGIWSRPRQRAVVYHEKTWFCLTWEEIDEYPFYSTQDNMILITANHLKQSPCGVGKPENTILGARHKNDDLS